MAKKKPKPRKKAPKKPAKKTARKVAKKPVGKAKAKAKAKPRKPARKPAAAKAAAPKGKARAARPRRAAAPAPPGEKEVPGGVLLGHVDDYFAHVGVAAVKLLAPVSVGDMIRIKGHTTDITQRVESMQIEHQAVQTASAGDSVGIKIGDRARRTDLIYKI
jgi:putative protease